MTSRPIDPNFDIEAAEAFLEALHGHLDPDDGVIAFGLMKHPRGALKHIYGYPGILPADLPQKARPGMNIYVSVCAFDGERWEQDPRPKTKDGKGRTPRQEDFALVAPACWTDIDGPDDPVDLHQWQEETRGALQDFHPEPSMIVFSGRGFHCYWILDPPVYLIGDNRARLFKEVKGCNLALRQRLTGADAVQDLARFLRLPGWMNPKNRKMCRVIKEDGPTYTLEILTEALGVLSMPEYESASGPVERYEVRFQPEPERRARGRPRKGCTKRDLRALPKWARDLVVGGAWQGRKTGRYQKEDGAPDRSRADMAVIGAMVKAGWSDDMILGAFTREDFLIGAKVQERIMCDGRKSALAYLARTIRKAREAGDD